MGFDEQKLKDFLETQTSDELCQICIEHNDQHYTANLFTPKPQSMGHEGTGNFIRTVLEKKQRYSSRSIKEPRLANEPTARRYPQAQERWLTEEMAQARSNTHQAECRRGPSAVLLLRIGIVAPFGAPLRSTSPAWARPPSTKWNSLRRPPRPSVRDFL